MPDASGFEDEIKDKVDWDFRGFQRRFDAAAKISVPAIFVVAKNEELSTNATLESVHKALVERGALSSHLG